MKNVFMMLGLILLNSFTYAQFLYTEKDFREQFGCNANETISQCKTRLRNAKLSQQDSIKREEEWRKFEKAKAEREQWEIEKERRDKLTPEERMKEDEKRRLAFEGDKKKKTEDGFDFTTGLIFSTKTGTTPDYSPLFGILLGVQTQVIPLSDEIRLGVGVLYSMQGGKYKSMEYIPGGEYGTSSATSRLTYLNFPVLVRYQKQRHGFFAEAGVQPGLLLSAKENGENIKDEVNKFDVGIPVGVGYQFKNKFGVGLRVTPGLMNINKDEQYKNRNMVASLRASYSL